VDRSTIPSGKWLDFRTQMYQNRSHYLSTWISPEQWPFSLQLVFAAFSSQCGEERILPANCPLDHILFPSLEMHCNCQEEKWSERFS
ncbi:hypothetical protein NDU88_004736, partial [Pleurodeles waltl]